MAEPTTLPALLRHNAERCGDERVIVTHDASITHAELDDRSRALAARLVASGCGPSARVGLLAPNGIEWATTAAAVARTGAVLVPLGTLLRPPELLAQVQAAAVTHLIAATGFRDRRYLDDLAEAAPGVHEALAAGGRHVAVPSLRAVWPIDALPTEAVAEELVTALEQRIGAANDLSVLFTSGSRGLPKGVVHTHGAALRAVASGLEARCVGRGEVLYIPMPFFWTGGFAGGLLTALVAGATLLTEAEPEPSRTLSLLARERATLFRGWPDQAARLAQHPSFATTDLSSLGDGSLAAVLPPERRPAPGQRANLFGMTESFGPYCGSRLDLDLPAEERGTCGRPFDGMEVRIVDPDTGTEVATGEQGEIWLRGPNLLRGICGRSRADVFTADGSYATGDLGSVDAAGYLRYAGRLDDMVKVKGATVYPSEVEAALRSVPGVRAAHVTDVDVDGRREVAALVDADASIAELATALKARLSSFKVPTRWLVRPHAEVPMLASAKVDKRGLQELLRREAQPGPG